MQGEGVVVLWVAAPVAGPVSAGRTARPAGGAARAAGAASEAAGGFASRPAAAETAGGAVSVNRGGDRMVEAQR